MAVVCSWLMLNNWYCVLSMLNKIIRHIGLTTVGWNRICAFCIVAMTENVRTLNDIELKAGCARSANVLRRSVVDCQYAAARSIEKRKLMHCSDDDSCIP